MDYFPAFLSLRGKSCLVVGGGTTATRKVRLLRKAGAEVLVIAPELSDELLELFNQRLLRYRPDRFDPSQLAGQRLVIAATNDPLVNQQIYQQADARGIFANSVDDPEHCSFITPAIVDRAPITVAISSGGAAPVLARHLREKIERLLPVRLGALATLAKSWRQPVKQAIGTVGDRREFWEQFFTGPAADHALAGQAAAAEQAATSLLSKHAGQQQQVQRAGQVALVGAGPGDPGLLTVRALQLMQLADVVLYDRLVSPSVLDLVRRDAELICVGKAPGAHSVDQSAINQLLVEHASEGRRVVRLKGGDPFIFGRGGEELQELRQAGISFQVVPGISAALGCSAYAGIPLTHRNYSHSVQFVTAHCKKLLECVDWPALARKGQTLVFYMGVKNLPHIQRELIAHGLDPKLPIALVENGTSDRQRVVTGQLDQLSKTARINAIQAPAILIVGKVVELREQCAWFDQDTDFTANPLRLAG